MILAIVVSTHDRVSIYSGSSHEERRTTVYKLPDDAKPPECFEKAAKCMRMDDAEWKDLVKFFASCADVEDSLPTMKLDPDTRLVCIRYSVQISRSHGWTDWRYGDNE